MTDIEANEHVAASKGTMQAGGKTWLIDPISDQITGTLHNFIRRHMKTPMAAIADSLKGLPEELQKIAIAEAVKLQINGGPEDKQGLFHEAMLSDEGCGFMFWLLARRNHPELTHAACTAMIAQGNAMVIMADLAAASGLTSLGGGGAGGN